MCVILLCEDGVRPTDEILAKCHERNKYGVGAAWRETDANGRTVVRWRKGMDLDDIIALTPTLPFPFIIHFRYPSANTSMRKEATHPFPVSADVPLELEGIFDGPVLFHNGFWGEWRARILEAAIRSGAKIPTDSWTDSRALAWMGYHYGPGFFELINEKIAIIDPYSVELFGEFGTNGGWRKEDDIWYSNGDWKHERVVYGPSGWMQAKEEHKAKKDATGDAASKATTDATKSQGTGGSSPAHPFRIPCLNAGGTGAAKVGGAGGQGQADQQKCLPQAAQSAAQGAGKGDEGDRKAGHAADADAVIDASIVDLHSRPCFFCEKVKAGVSEDGLKICWECHHELRMRTDESLTVSQYPELDAECEQCSQVQVVPRKAIAITMEGNEWICGPCWVRLNRPRLVPRKTAEAVSTFTNADIVQTADLNLIQRRADAARGITRNPG